jgi:DNA mismatch endonuclease, patch repair protein
MEGTGAASGRDPGGPDRRPLGDAGRRASSPPPSSEAAGRRMRATRRTATAAEELVRTELDRLGLAYEVDEAPIADLRRRADVVFENERVAVYVDGCFWHGCPMHGTWPKANADFWRNKIEANRRRDADTNERLAHEGWHVMRFWEHDDPVQAARAVARAVGDARSR